MTDSRPAVVRPDIATSIAWFRDASPYIDAHRGRTLVLALPGTLLRSDVLPTLTQDLTLLSHLGLRLVLCFGLRAQMDERLAARALESCIVDGRRVTDDAALAAIVGAAGRARTDLEARLSMGLPNTPMAGAHVPVSSGNFVAARPFGVHDGVDFRHTGTVREVRVAALRSLLDAGHLVLLPPLGHSLTGDVFNLPVDEVAECVAVALGADKLVYFVDALPRDGDGLVIRQSSVPRLERLLDGDELSGERAGGARAVRGGGGEVGSAPARARPSGADAGTAGAGGRGGVSLHEIARRACRACRAGVARVHLLESGDPDALLTELFSRDGSGTMVTANRWDHVREARIDDVGGIIELIAPLQESGALVARSREQLELDIERFVVSERDGAIIACAALHLAPEDTATAEIACVATHPDYRGEGRADALLTLLEERAREAGAQRVLLLSTRAGHWFVERGYVETAPDALPPTRRALYDRRRNSKVYEKALRRAGGP